MATHHRYVPRPPLSAYVESFWLYHGTEPLHTKERRLPDGSMSLIINLRDDSIRLYDQLRPDQLQTHSGSVISGAHSTFLLLDTASLVSVIGVQFKPGGAAPFLPLPAAELHSKVLSLDDLWGRVACNLRDQLLSATTPACCFHILDVFLLARLALSHAAHPAVAAAVYAFQREGRDISRRPAVSVVAERIGLSQTRFIQLFREAVGLTPKQFCRINRFQQALAILESGEPVRWAALAAVCGYFDQAHLIHDFQSFSGLTPATYAAARGEHRNHIALPG